MHYSLHTSQALVTAHQHNGKEGTVCEHIPDTGRFRIALDSGDAVSVKASNLRLATAARPNLTVEFGCIEWKFKLGLEARVSCQLCPLGHTAAD